VDAPTGLIVASDLAQGGLLDLACSLVAKSERMNH
jgi:hypothetical protein